MSAEPKPPAPHAAGPGNPVAGRDGEGKWLVRHVRQHPKKIISLLCPVLVLVGIGVWSQQVNRDFQCVLKSGQPFKRHPQSVGRRDTELARSRYDKGDCVAAETLYRRALAARERELGDAHPDTLISVHDLAGVLKVKGDLAGAEVLYRRALTGWERTLGSEHGYTCGCQYNLADLLRNQGELKEAESLTRQLYGRWLTNLGAEHGNTQTAKRLLDEITAKLPVK